MATKDPSRRIAVNNLSAPPMKKKTQPNKPGTSVQKKLNSTAPKRVGTLQKTAPKGVPSKPKSEAAKQLGALTQPLAVRKKAEAVQKAKASAGRRSAAAVPTGRGASAAATKKNTPGTVTRGKSNFVLDALRNAANSMTTNREKAINEKLWREGGNRPAPKKIAKSAKPKGK